jgi:F-type H+-transporting ATPase subunit alpha
MPERTRHRGIEPAARALLDAGRLFTPRMRWREEGRVRSLTDGVVRLSGLPSVPVESLVEIDGGGRALVLGVGPDGVLAACLEDATGVRAGARARAISGPLAVDVGESLLSRVIDPLGRSLDGSPIGAGSTRMPLEPAAPGIYKRARVHQPLHTGTLAVDAMFPIGRGQRELILGNEGTGKTALAVDAILRQRDTDVIGVFVAIGRRRDEVWQIVESLRHGAGRWVVVAAFEDANPAMRHLAPYAGCAVAEYFVRRGEHALVVYDDLTAHASAWRELSLLLRRPPGREAFPGDIFYIHARLLERATQLSPEEGGGSLTALPIARLEGGRLSAYIPTNLISMTDGQVVLSESLFAAGQKPAVDAGLSVSRVGGRAQPQAVRQLAERLRLDYAGFLELESFARLGTRLDAATEQRLAWGRRTRLLLRGPRLAPASVFSHVVRLCLAADLARLERIPEAHIEELAASAVDELARRLPGVAERVDADGTLSAEDRSALERALGELIDARYGKVA